MNKKPQLMYSIIAICSVVLYMTFLIRGAITDANSTKEDIPYNPPAREEKVVVPPPTENILSVMENVTNVKHKEVVEEETETPTEEATLETPEKFSPILPVSGEISQKFSLTHSYNEKTGDWRAHSGIDITADKASRVLAVEDGTVTKCIYDPLWGNVIEIDHGEYVSIYKNLSTLIMVKEGDWVKRGEAISGVGHSASAEGYLTDHLHFEMKHYSDYIDPLSIIGAS